MKHLVKIRSYCKICWNDICDRPTFLSQFINDLPPSGGGGSQVNSDWNAMAGPALILNKPTIPTLTSQLTNNSGFITAGAIPTMISAFTNDVGYITSAAIPTLISAFTNDVGYITFAAIPTKTSQLINDSGFITSAAIIPQVNSDWNSIAGVSQILNKPTLALVATSGLYSDLIGLPTIPTLTSQLTNDSGFITAASIPIVYYGEMYQYENVVLTAIGDKNVYHGIGNYVAGTLNGFTFKTSTTATILSVANYSGTVPGTILVTTTAPHNFVTGEPINQHATTDYNGMYIVNVVSPTTYYVIKAFTVSRTGNVSRGSTLRATVAGTYATSFSVTAFPTNANKTFKFEIVKNIISQDNIVGSRAFQTSTDYSGMTASGIVTVTVGDYIWLAAANQTDAVDITVRHSNVNLHKI